MGPSKDLYLYSLKLIDSVTFPGKFSSTPIHLCIKLSYKLLKISYLTAKHSVNTEGCESSSVQKVINQKDDNNNRNILIDIEADFGNYHQGILFLFSSFVAPFII